LETTHDAFRRRDGAFRKSWAGARAAVQKGYTVTVSVVAHAKNVDEIPILFEEVRRDIKPRIFRVMFIDPLGRAAIDREYLLSPKQTRQVLEFLKDEYGMSCADYSDSATTMVELGCGGWLGKEYEGLVRPFIFHCIAGINNLGILYDGKLASCSNIPREFIEGDLRHERIKDVWENRYQRYRDPEWKRTGICAGCSEWDFCHGGPMHLQRGDHLCCVGKSQKGVIR
jgi:radical SAM protein with 4Fe4S-binding SPASM domain